MPDRKLPESIDPNYIKIEHPPEEALTIAKTWAMKDGKTILPFGPSSFHFFSQSEGVDVLYIVYRLKAGGPMIFYKYLPLRKVL